ncbi:iron-containing alcohol dehydrogenase, partial [Chloroflexota bacterium]
MVDIARGENCNCVVGAGGGSVIVASKGTALTANNEGKTIQYTTKEDGFPNPPLLCVIMPTNAGSGAEVSKGTTITDVKTGNKVRIRGYRHAVRLTILDPMLLVTVTRGQTIASGVDALTHALEAYLSEKASPLTDCVALKSIEMIVNNLCKSVFTVDIEAKGAMLLGSTMANIAVSNSTVGLSHILNMVVTDIYKKRDLDYMAYGMIHAVLLPPTLEFNLAACPDKVAPLAQSMCMPVDSKSQAELIKGIMDRLDNILTDLSAPRKLIWKELTPEDIIESGIKSGHLVLDTAKQDAHVIRKYTREDLVCILSKVLS